MTTTDYDALGRVTRVIRLPGTPDEAITTYTYDPVWTSEVARSTDPLNHTTTFEYDDRGNRVRIKDALNHATTFTYNVAGQITSATDPLQHTTTFEYAGPDLVKIRDPLDRVTQRFYDAAGRLIAETDPAGQTTRFAYDEMSQVTQVTDALGQITAFGYDPAGRLLSVTDALAHATTYRYDVFGRLTSTTDPLSKVDTLTYDLKGNVDQQTDRKGQLTTHLYDALNRLQQIRYADNSTITYTYDAGNRVRTMVDSAGGTITRDYDAHDRLIAETTPQGAVSYTYDKADRRAAMSTPGQPTVIYGYDDANRLTSVTQGTAAVMLTYDDGNRRTSLRLPNGIEVGYSYDDASQLTGLTYTMGQTTLGTLMYAYDLAGRRREIGGTLARTRLPQPVTSAAYDAANRVTRSAGSLASYDSDGNLASDGVTSYLWNARNELAGLTGPISAAFEYDAIVRRHTKTVSGRTAIYLHDGVDPVQERSPDGLSATRLLGASVDEWWLRTDGSGTVIPLTDALGSTIELFDPTGAPVAQYTYDPFGATSVSGSGVATPFAYTGREIDTGDLYYYRARYYSPLLHRFISEDPVGLRRGGLNLHSYVGDNPIAQGDPSGLTFSSNFAFLLDWLAGGGGRNRSYGPTDIETFEMRNSLAAKKMREEFIRNQCKNTAFNYGTVEAAWDTVLNPWTNNFGSTAAQFGGFAGATVVNNGNGTATYTIKNVAGTHSFFYHVVPDRRSQDGYMRNIGQAFVWTEPIPCECRQR